MKNISFVPQKFENVKLGYREISENNCSPLFGEVMPMNSILINIPDKIKLRSIDGVQAIPIIPVCGRYSVTIKRSLKYSDASGIFYTLKDLETDEIYSGKIYANDLENEHNYPDDYDKEAWEERKRAIAEAQKYSDDELNDGPGGSGYFNINLMEYMNISTPLGKYELWLSLSGLESNHMRVEIVIEK